MEKPRYQPGKNTEKYSRQAAELQRSLRRISPQTIANRTKTAYTYTATNPNKGFFKFYYWGKPVILTYPDLLASYNAEYPLASDPLSLFDQIVILYYFFTADGVPQAGKWIAFSELANGRFYDAAFQSYTNRPLAENFHNQQKQFSKAATTIGGKSINFADAAFSFQILPSVTLLAAYWEGDEDFFTSIRILFDASANHYLPTDGYAILGSFLTRKLIAAKKINQGQHKSKP